MQVAGLFRVVRRRDRVALERFTKTLSAKGSSLDVRILYLERGIKPLLLVSTPRKTGSATERNQFRRRVRMAFLKVLRQYSDTIVADLGNFVFWVRPAYRNPAGCRIEYRDIEKQIELTLGCMRHP